MNNTIFDFEIRQEQRDELSKLLEQSGNIKRGILMSAIVNRLDAHYVFVDVGLKSEGRIPKEEFNINGEGATLPAPGDSITVFLEALENKNGDIVLSYTKALREAGWGQLEEFFQKRETVLGTVIRKVQGGCIVNLSGVSAFLPKSHFPLNIKDVKELFGKQHSCFIIRMDRVKSNIVVSLKNSNDSEGITNFAEGQIVQGTVKGLTDIIAFIDLGGVTGRLHISEISWKKIKDPASVLKIGEVLNVKIISISQSNKISLSLKELLENPWNDIIKEHDIKIDNVYEGQVKFIEERMASVQILPNIEAKLKSSDVSWLKRRQNFDEFKKDQKISVKVIEIDTKRNKIFVSMKHATENPLEEFAQTHKVGDEIKCQIVQISELGYVAQINEQLDGLIPKTSAYVSGNIKIGETVKAYIWSISVENSRIMLGVNKPSAL